MLGPSVVLVSAKIKIFEVIVGDSLVHVKDHSCAESQG